LNLRYKVDARHIELPECQYRCMLRQFTGLRVLYLIHIKNNPDDVEQNGEKDKDKK